MANAAEWIDGFLFVGNQRALDFLNTRLIDDAGPVELLPDVAALERWLVASGILSEREMKSASHLWGGSESAERFLRDLLAFRESLRAAVFKWEAGFPPGRRFLAELNQKLLAFPARYLLSVDEGGIHRQVFLQPEKPDDLWAPIAEATGQLFTQIPSSRVRKCQNCIVHFHDVSKKGSRRWCSMNLCGNRDKVATYRHKRRVSR